jgi:hypothetical protein
MHRRGHRDHPWRRRWGRRRDYNLSPPSTIWYNPWSWFGSCKDGCLRTGNGQWGCPVAGTGVNDCVFASDCYGCG